MLQRVCLQVEGQGTQPVFMRHQQAQPPARKSAEQFRADCPDTLLAFLAGSQATAIGWVQDDQSGVLDPGRELQVEKISTLHLDRWGEAG